MTDISSNIRQFYSRFNNVLSVIGKGSMEMCTLHLNKVYCLTSLSYGCETWTLNEQSIKRVNIFGGFWRESVKSLQFFCQTLPTHGNSFLLSLLRLVQNRFYVVASGYGISSISVSVSHIKSAVWAKFTDSVNLHVYLYILMAQTLLCILASYCFSVLAFCCFILYALPYGVIIINNNNNNYFNYRTAQ